MRGMCIKILAGLIKRDNIDDSKSCKHSVVRSKRIMGHMFQVVMCVGSLAIARTKEKTIVLLCWKTWIFTVHFLCNHLFQYPCFTLLLCKCAFCVLIDDFEDKVNLIKYQNVFS